ncbi:hypothetical protein PPERSA_01748 [Pseudocohnilembus persalinus]|uniref:ER membrane protein complex subunit 7 beta-sandwich domain-containing protein n=1 Tax=Pseudocohnilembus persalinus TaxID=266149 RepID=A0A0V0R190_PSEPJ|nr:hypothetical protein PPERSA_01748 [Pseudocohnilembus persalinus]|eukprot:KRX08287.1 hypothetical protein PPERSA_01748 [Pseudocohnilembus persalinus]
MQMIMDISNCNNNEKYNKKNQLLTNLFKNSNNIPMGKYSLEVNNNEFIYEKVILNLYAKGNTSGIYSYKVNPLTMAKDEQIRSDGIIEIRPLQKIIYFDKEEQIITMGLLTSPYMIMGGVILGLYLCMKVMPDMDELQKQAQSAQQQ